MERANQSIGGVYNRCHEVSKKEERTQKINKIKHLELNKTKKHIMVIALLYICELTNLEKYT